MQASAEGRNPGCSVVDEHPLLGALQCYASGKHAVPHVAWFTIVKVLEVVRVGMQQTEPAGGKWTREGCLPGLDVVQCTLGQPFRLTGCKHRHALPEVIKH